MDGEAGAALIAAAASIVVSVVSLAGTWLTSRRAAAAAREQAQFATDLEDLKSRRADENEAARARRDYEYEARKRLYAELYPLVFQLQEAANSACNRVKNLARATRQGHLAPGPENWLTIPDPYYFHSTLHALLAPLAIHELMTRQLTLFDLNLDPDLRRRRHLARRAYQSLRSDFDLIDAERYPAIVFDPANPAQTYDPPEMAGTLGARPIEERWRWRQGLYSGQIGEVVETLLMTETNSRGATTTRTKSYPEFIRSLGVKDLRDTNAATAAPTAAALRPMVELLRDFHPGRRPITWRIFITQASCYRAILAGEALGSGDADSWANAGLNTETDRKPYVWLDGDVPAELGLEADFVRSEIAGAFDTGRAVLAELAADYGYR